MDISMDTTLFELRDIILNTYHKMNFFLLQSYNDICFGLGNTSIKTICLGMSIYIFWKVYMKIGRAFDRSYKNARQFTNEELYALDD